MISIIYDIAKFLVLPHFQKWWKRRGKMYFQKLVNNLWFAITRCKNHMKGLRFKLYWKLFPIIAFFKGYYKFQERWVKNNE